MRELGRLAAAIGLLGTAACGSGQTRQKLDRTYEATQVERPEPPPKEQERAERALAEALERDFVVTEAVARSPALAVMAHRVRALVHAGRAEGSLPSAELGFEVWNLPLERPYSLNEADMYMVELRQRFPAAGSLDARARAMAEEAQALLAELSSEERLVAERAASAFADYAQAFAEKQLQERQLESLVQMGQAVRARYTTRGAGLAEVARIDVEVAKAERALARTVGDIARARATLNAVLRRPASAPLGEPRALPAETVRLTVEELLQRASASRGTTLSAEAKVRAASARREAAEAEARVPEFMVGLGYWQQPGMRPGMGITSSMSLPWLWGPGGDRVRQAEAEESAERAARDGVGLEVQTEVSEAWARLASLEQQLQLIERQSLPATRRSMEALTLAFSTGGASLLEWVDVARALLDLELESVVLRGDLARNVAGLERAVGSALPHSPLSDSPLPSEVTP
ncbi:MAG TPA: TolC family protein [Polyangiaceae bacterium]|nr:TolC family protein [Polyangiaceae bacterium]